MIPVLKSRAGIRSSSLLAEIRSINFFLRVANPDGRSADAQAIEVIARRRRDTNRLGREIAHLSVRDLLYGFQEIDLVRIDGVIGLHLLGRLQAEVRRVGNDDVFRAAHLEE